MATKTDADVLSEIKRNLERECKAILDSYHTGS
jgi:hypothetical protein